MNRIWRFIEQVLAVWIVVVLVTWPVFMGFIWLHDELTSIVDISRNGNVDYKYSPLVRTTADYGSMVLLVISPLYLYVLIRTALWMHRKIRPAVSRGNSD